MKITQKMPKEKIIEHLQNVGYEEKGQNIYMLNIGDYGYVDLFLVIDVDTREVWIECDSFDDHTDSTLGEIERLLYTGIVELEDFTLEQIMWRNNK